MIQRPKSKLREDDFKGMNSQFANCYQHFTHLFLQAGDTLMTYGEVGDKYYYILQGRVAIEVPIDPHPANRKSDS